MPTNSKKMKKRVVTSYINLSEELKQQLKELYPTGFEEKMIRVDKGNGDFFYAVVMETEEISYLVKLAVKVDELTEEEEDKDYYDDEIKGAEDIADTDDEDDE